VIDLIDRFSPDTYMPSDEETIGDDLNLEFRDDDAQEKEDNA
jgi:hypothetical protein